MSYRPFSTYINKQTIAQAKINFSVCCQDCGFSVTTVYTLTQQADGLMTVNLLSALCSIKPLGHRKQKCAIYHFLHFYTTLFLSISLFLFIYFAP